METTDLHIRMEALGKRIDETTATIKREDHLMHDHHLTGIELKDRYKMLQQRLNDNIEHEKAHGQHVGALEQSVREWIISIGA